MFLLNENIVVPPPHFFLLKTTSMYNEDGWIG